MKSLYISIIFSLLVVSGFAQADLANLVVGEKNTAVELNFTALSEANMRSHIIERSTNGADFTAVGTLAAQNSTTPYKYRFIDAAPVQGPNYYRVRSESSAGVISYSPVAQLNMGANITDIAVLPNPVRNGVVNLQFNNLVKGRYAINIYSANGQQVFTMSKDHPGGYSTEILNLPGNIGKGMFFLQVTSGMQRMNKQLFLQ